LRPKGIEVNDVLIRDIQLPDRLIAQIQQKKETEQQAERQKAELIRFETEQQQQVVQAKAQRQAAEEEAQRRKLIADAQAYEIEKINQAVAQNPAYIQLQAIEALKSISKDPAAKMYFMNGESAMPLPLMNIGEPLK
jgi:regulator of protease activity HflC (stomatin/prohibitin superfamily)